MSERPFSVEALHFQSGDIVETGETHLTIIVGANGSGKTRLLQEIAESMTNPGHAVPKGAVLQSITLSKEMDPAQVEEWARAPQRWWEDGNVSVSLPPSPRRFHPSSIAQTWSSSDWAENSPIFELAVKGLWCQSRLQVPFSSGRYDPMRPPQDAVQLLLACDELRDSLDRTIAAAFKRHLVAHSWGSETVLRISSRYKQEDLSFTSANGHPSASDQAILDELAAIETQGDGIRAFTGILLELHAYKPAIALLDEPEAFLHPPQARELGRQMAVLGRATQMFVATHSLDFVLGALDASPTPLRLVRLERKHDGTQPHTLQPMDLTQAWKDPTFRFARLLEGLFHPGAIICEGVTDAQFFTMNQSDELDVMITYAGDKDRLARSARALRALGVPVAVIADFDVLRNVKTVEALLQALGGTLSEDTREILEDMDKGLREPGLPGSRAQALEKITEVLGTRPHEPLSTRDVRAIRALVRNPTPWERAKKEGLEGLPEHLRASLERGLDMLAGHGLFVIPSGEVESFVKEIDGHGPRWLDGVIQSERASQVPAAKDLLSKALRYVLQ